MRRPFGQKTLLLAGILACLAAAAMMPSPALAAEGDLLWTRTYGSGTLWELGDGVAVDSANNIYVIGSQGMIDYDMFLRKYDSTGAFQWMQTYNGGVTQNAYGYGVAVDSGNNIYVTGHQTTTTNGNDMFLRKYDSAGAFQWMRTYNSGAGLPDYGYGIAVDFSNNIYVTGYQTTNGGDMFLRKYDSAGALQWTRAYESGSLEKTQGNGVAIDSGNNIYVTGYQNTNGNDMILFKYDSSGNLQWIRTYNSGPLRVDYGYGVAVDFGGNIYVTGVQDTNDGDMFLRKYDSTGAFQWMQTYNSGGLFAWDYGYGVAVDSGNNIYVTGEHYQMTTGSPDIFLRKYDSAGTFQWAQTYDSSGSGSDSGRGVAVDLGNNIDVVGYQATDSTVDNMFLWQYDGGGLPPPPPPTVTFTATPSTINIGDPSTLDWSCSNTTQYDDVVPPTEWLAGPILGDFGSQVVWPLATTTYTISCTGPGGSATQSVIVNVGSGGVTWIEERITGAPDAERYPDISGNLIVWDDNRDPGGGILGCVYGGNCDGGLFGWQISQPSEWAIEPAIDGSFVVWQQFTATNWDIFIYDGISQTLQITNNSAVQWYTDISGNRVVWEDMRNGPPGDIYSCVYDEVADTCPEQQITTNPAGQGYPAISGNLIVWMDYRSGFNPNIYVYEVDTAEEVPITAGGISSMSYPAISGNRIVWENSDDIYLCVYDSATNSCSSTKQITTDPSQQIEPAISGNRVVWVDGRNGNADIYSCVYDEATNTCPEEPITTNLADQRFPSIDGNKVVWADLRNDTGMGTNFDIYLASSSGGGGTPPTVTLTANPATITSGEYSDLTWVTTDATSCNDVEPPDWLAGPVGGDPGGTQRIWPTATDTYTIECTGPGSPPTAQDSVTVTVNPPPPPPPEGSCGNLIWGEIINLANYITANDIALGGDGVYVVGVEGGNDKWRMEKRNFSGNVLWTKNFDGDIVTAEDVTADNTGVYIVGSHWVALNDYQWRIEKRDLDDGNLLWTQDSNPTAPPDGGLDIAYGVAVDATGVYIVGEQTTPSSGDSYWRMEKRSLTDGTLIWEQTINPSSSTRDQATSVVVNGSGLYVVGWEFGSKSWRIEKRDPATGGLIWARTSKYGTATTLDRANNVAIDSTGIYVVGWHYPPAGGNEDWRTEKWDFDGNQVWQQPFPNSGQDWAEAVAVDGTGVYVGGSIAAGNYSSHMRKLSLTDGSTLCSVTTGATFPQDPGEMTTVRGLAVNCRGVYWAGEYNSGVDITWTVAFRQASNGLMDCGLRVYDGSTVVPVCCEDPPLSPLRIQKDATTYGVNLVDPAAVDATPVIIQTPSGPKALRRQ